MTQRMEEIEMALLSGVMDFNTAVEELKKEGFIESDAKDLVTFWAENI